MNKQHFHLGAIIMFALLAAGCETEGGIAARTREKSAAYATLKLSEKRFINKGVIALGFTPDMVYMAMGHPTTVETKDYPDGRRELWTYRHYYPNYDAGQGFRYAPYTEESHYHPVRSTSFTDGSPYGSGRQMPVGFGPDANNPQIHFGGPPQGGTTEPAELQSFTVSVLFKDGKVARFGADPNVN